MPVGRRAADRPTLTQAVAVHECLQRCLVCTVGTGRPQRVRLVQQTVVEDHLVDGTCRDEHEARYAALEGGMEELQRSGQVDAEEDARFAVTTASAVAWAGPLDSRVDNRVCATEQFKYGRLIPQHARHPVDGVAKLLEPATIAPGPVPAADPVSFLGQMLHKIPTEEPHCACDGHLHNELRRTARSGDESPVIVAVTPRTARPGTPRTPCAADARRPAAS